MPILLSLIALWSTDWRVEGRLLCSDFRKCFISIKPWWLQSWQGAEACPEQGCSRCEEQGVPGGPAELGRGRSSPSTHVAFSASLQPSCCLHLSAICCTPVKLQLADWKAAAMQQMRAGTRQRRAGSSTLGCLARSRLLPGVAAAL